jgi:hypothetical protein
MNTDLARCDREIAEASQQMEAPAWLVTLWAEDWNREREWIERERASTRVLVLPAGLRSIR